MGYILVNLVEVKFSTNHARLGVNLLKHEAAPLVPYELQVGERDSTEDPKF